MSAVLSGTILTLESAKHAFVGSAALASFACGGRRGLPSRVSPLAFALRIRSPWFWCLSPQLIRVHIDAATRAAMAATAEERCLSCQMSSLFHQMCDTCRPRAAAVHRSPIARDPGFSRRDRPPHACASPMLLICRARRVWPSFPVGTRGSNCTSRHIGFFSQCGSTLNTLRATRSRTHMNFLLRCSTGFTRALEWRTTWATRSSTGSSRERFSRM